MPAATGGSVAKRYLESAFGQLHLRYVAPERSARRGRAALLIVPSPNSAELYNELLVELGRDRVALAFDTPGYGESTPPPEAISDPLVLAGVFAQGLTQLGVDSIDAYGHHSGAMLSMALAALDHTPVHRVVVSGVPYVADLAERRALRDRFQSFADKDRLHPYIDRNLKFWVQDRPVAVSLDRATELFVDSLSAGSRMNWLYRAAYADDPETWMSRIQAPVTFLQIDDFLSPNSLRAAEHIAHGQIRRRPDLDHWSLIARAADIAEELRAAFDVPSR